MKKLIFTLIVLMSGYGISAQTPVPGGDISGTWNLAGSPYMIQGETTVPVDSTLVIEPGVEIIWEGNFEMWIMGRILAEGTEADSIFFKPALADTGFGSVRFDSLAVSSDSSHFSYCHFENGKARGAWPNNSGGAIASYKATKFSVRHCFFKHNQGMYDPTGNAGGGAIALWSASPVIENCVFTGNSTLYGGAIILYEGSNAIIRDCLFEGNAASHDGGAICNWEYSYPVISGNIFRSNAAVGYGGAIDFYVSSSGQIDHNLFINNTVVLNGGALSIYDNCSPELTNNTFYGNQSSNGGALFITVNSAPVIRNCILWNDQANNGPEVSIFTGSTPEFYYSDIEGDSTSFGGIKPVPGVYMNNMNAYPEFADTSAGDPHLKSSSPCIDAGDPDPMYNDPDGTRNDIGAYFFPQWPQGVAPLAGTVSPGLRVYPNPVRSEATVIFHLVRPASVRVILFNHLGQEVMFISGGLFPAGSSTVAFDAAGLTPGIYFCRIQADDRSIRSETRKVIIY